MMEDPVLLHADGRHTTKEVGATKADHDGQPPGDVSTVSALGLPLQEGATQVAEGDNSSESFVPSEAPEIIRHTTISVLEERIRLLGINRSGAYEHYSLQLSKGFPIPSYEIEILDLVRRRLPDLHSYHEVGSGLGTLPLMLAHDGFTAVGIERDERRHLTATTIMRKLASTLPRIDDKCRLLGAAFPDAVGDLDVCDSMAIVTDFVSSQSPSDYVRLCWGLARYRYVLLDLQRFCIKREAAQDQERLVEELAKFGLLPCPEIIDLEDEGLYQLFESTPAARSRPATQDVVAATVDPATTSSTDPKVAKDAPVDDKGSRTTSGSLVPSNADTSSQTLVVGARGDLSAMPPNELAVRGNAGSPPSVFTGFVIPPRPQRARRARFGGLLGISALIVVGLPTLLAALYYGIWASSQYVTTFQFAVRGPSQAAASRAGPAGVGAMSPDAFVVTDYINSPQAIADVEHNVDLRTIFSQPTIDPWSRLATQVTVEQLSAYWARMVWAHFDLVSGNVSVSVRAFTPEDSLKLAEALIVSANVVFQRLNTQAQHDFVRLANENVARAQRQLTVARQALLTFREESGLVDLDKTAQAGSVVIDELRKQLVGLQSQYASIKKVSPRSPNLITLTAQMAAIEAQIKNADRRVSTPVNAVTPETLGQYQSLDLDRQFAEKDYTEALGLRNQAYLMAQNQQSYLALFVHPTLAQQSLYPDRIKSIAIVLLAAALAWFVGMLITYAIRDHLI